MRELIKILSIDGGGIRGIIPGMVLASIEKRTGKPIAELFHLVAGTSTGGILALGLTVPKVAGSTCYSAQDMVEMYAREGARIFSRSLWRRFTSCQNLAHEKYSCDGIEEVLLEYFGESRLADATTDLLIPSYETERGFPFFFKSRNAHARPSYDFAARDVARATSAAPTYFAPKRLREYTLIDGGVYANNPAACALVEARATYPEAGGYLVVSVGSGVLNHSISFEKAKNWGVAMWAMPLLNIVFDGVSSTVDYQLKQLLPDSYYRFQPTLRPRTHSIDNTSAANIAALKALGAELAQKESKSLDTICEQLASDYIPVANGEKRVS